MNWTQEQIDQTLRAVIERSFSDPSFRAAALADGNAAVAKVSATAVPSDFRIRFVDNAGHDLTVVLPDAPPAAQPRQELSDEAVAGVAGGTIGIFTGACVNFTAHTCIANATACNPGYTKKPGSPAFCPNY